MSGAAARTGNLEEKERNNCKKRMNDDVRVAPNKQTIEQRQ